MRKTYVLIAVIVLIVMIAAGVTALGIRCQKNNETRLKFEQTTGITLPANVHIGKSAEIEGGYAYSITMDYETYQKLDYALRYESNFDESTNHDIRQSFVDALIRRSFPLQLGWVQRNEKEFISGFTTLSNRFDRRNSSFVVVLFLKSKTSDEIELITEW